MTSRRALSPIAALLFVAGACGGDDGAGATNTSSAAEASTGGETTAGEATTQSSSSADESEVSTQTATQDSSEGPLDTSSTGEPLSCNAPPACDTPTPDPGQLVEWNHTESTFVANAGAPNHRGRDMFYLPGDEQWVMAKFAYSVNDWDLSGEQIDLFLLRGCEGMWEPIGTTITTFDDEHAEVEGVVDTGGRIYVQIPAALELAPGRHRIWAVVRGDATSADVYIDVVEPGTPFFLTDVDGTLTTSENEEFGALLSGSLPMLNPSAPEALWALVDKGYHAFYLTARPEFLGRRTRELIDVGGLPPGLYHTTLSFTGALGDAAIQYKSDELDRLAERQLVPSWTFGNTSSDGDAYEHAGVQPLEQRIFFQYDDTHGGRRIDDFAALVPELQGVAPVCD